MARISSRARAEFRGLTHRVALVGPPSCVVRRHEGISTASDGSINSYTVLSSGRHLAESQLPVSSTLATPTAPFELEFRDSNSGHYVRQGCVLVVRLFGFHHVPVHGTRETRVRGKIEIRLDLAVGPMTHPRRSSPRGGLGQTTVPRSSFLPPSSPSYRNPCCVSIAFRGDPRGAARARDGEGLVPRVGLRWLR